jgi:hypothetical protein
VPECQRAERPFGYFEFVITEVTIGCVCVIGVAHRAAGALSLASRRRREAKALRTILLDQVTAGRRSAEDPAVRQVLDWADEVVRA